MMILVFGAIITIINIIFSTNPVFNEKTGITVFNVLSIVASLIFIITIIFVGFAGMLFPAKSSKLRDKAKIKAIFLGIGMIVIMIGGPMRETAKNIAEYFLADFLVAVAFIIVMFGIYYEQLNAKNEKGKIAYGYRHY